MGSKPRRVAAAVDIGSNSVHLLVAEVRGGGLRYLRDESVLLGLGDGVEAYGELTPLAQGQLIGALRGYSDLARSLGANPVTFLGTHPLRVARNGRDVAAAVEQSLGLPLQVLDETAEAQLTFLGATGGKPPAGSLLVTDIGGGSSEIIVAAPGQPLRIASLPSGSARLSRGIVLADPPTPNEFDRLRLAARALVRELAWAPVQRGLFVGGTATNLARLAPLSRAGVEAAHSVLTSTTQAELVGRYLVNPRRASQLAAGAALVEALLVRFGLDEVDVSQASLRDGAIIAAQRLGRDWPAGLGRLVGAV